MQAVLYANKTFLKKKKAANHLGENEQLMHIEYKNPHEFFFQFQKLAKVIESF